MIGNFIGGYRLVGTLGEGGMGVVYLGERPEGGSRAAIKVLHRKLARDADAVGRLFNEARAASMIRHPGIVGVLDVGYHELTGSAYIIMELLEGETLGHRIDRVGCLDEPKVVALALQLTGALEAAHDKGIVHRDLTPDNVFLVPQAEALGGERAKLLDFGAAKLTAELGLTSVRTRTGHFVGSPNYMSPEQCKGGVEVDARADVYSLGGVMMEMVSGKPPFVGAGVGEIFAKKIYESAPRALARAPGISPALAAVIDRALARSPEARFPSMTAMAQAIADVASGRAPARVGRGPRRAVMAAMIGALLVLLAAVAAVLIAGPR